MLYVSIISIFSPLSRYLLYATLNLSRTLREAAKKVLILSLAAKREGGGPAGWLRAWPLRKK